MSFWITRPFKVIPLKQALIGQHESSLVWKGFWGGRNNLRWPISAHIDSTGRSWCYTCIKKWLRKSSFLHSQDVRELWTLVLSWFKVQEFPQREAKLLHDFGKRLKQRYLGGKISHRFSCALCKKKGESMNQLLSTAICKRVFLGLKRRCSLTELSSFFMVLARGSKCGRELRKRTRLILLCNSDYLDGERLVTFWWNNGYIVYSRKLFVVFS